MCTAILQLSGFSHGAFAPDGLKALARAVAMSPIASLMPFSAAISRNIKAVISMMSLIGSWRRARDSRCAAWRRWRVWSSSPVAGRAEDNGDIMTRPAASRAVDWRRILTVMFKALLSGFALVIDLVGFV